MFEVRSLRTQLLLLLSQNENNFWIGYLCFKLYHHYVLRFFELCACTYELSVSCVLK
jgi:hypothetical protein